MTCAEHRGPVVLFDMRTSEIAVCAPDDMSRELQRRLFGHALAALLVQLEKLNDD